MSMDVGTILSSEEKPKDIERYWLKIFNDIQTDMRFVTMSYEHQGIYFNLLVLANNPFGVGRIFASREDVARGLRISKKKLDMALDDFEARSLVFVEGNTIQVVDERHYTGPGLNPSDSRAAKAERMRDWRARTKVVERERLHEEAMRSSHQRPASEGKGSEEQGSDEKDQIRDVSLAYKGELSSNKVESVRSAEGFDPPYLPTIDGHEDIIAELSDGIGPLCNDEEVPLL